MTDAALEEGEIRPVVERFYARVRADEALGPVFAAAIDDWNDHHARLTDFWSSVMLTSGRYKGNPVVLHARHAEALTPEAFARWLQLWGHTTDEMLPPATAKAMQAKAARIAESLQLALHYRSASRGALL
ncbi:group III truncated hemoglobin [Sphingomonas sp.]|uniref:group III truncated hemoglobin n=1 Tax=Sphingomonas sp. TaxID=28214 RepID=UPI0028B13111|nr:group III truncated hemoglobin [Sphingomonas sp.]